MFDEPFWAWFWAGMFLLGIVGAARAYRRNDRATLRQSGVGAMGTLALSHWLSAASTTLTSIGIVLLVVSALDGLFSGRGRAA